MAGFLSFLVMDLQPMQEFGWQMAMGTGICGVLALLVIPAFLVRYPITATRTNRVSQMIDDALVAAGSGAKRRKGFILALLAIVGVTFGMRLTDIETRMDISSFFKPESAPARADKFLTNKFSGSVFLQIFMEGDMTDPVVLQQVAAFEDRLHSIEGVTRVESITNVLAIINAAFSGERRLATTREGLKYHGYLGQMSDPAVGLLIDDDWTGALLQVALGKFDTEVVREVTAAARTLAEKSVPKKILSTPASTGDLRDKVLRDAAERIVDRSGAEASLKEPIFNILQKAKPGIDTTTIAPKVQKILAVEIGEEEMVLLKDGVELTDFAQKITADMGDGTFNSTSFRKRLEAIADPEELDDPKLFGNSVSYLYAALSKLTGNTTATPIVNAVLDALGPELPIPVKHRVSAIVHDVLASSWSVDATWLENTEGAAPLQVTVSGYPVVQEAMTQSVHNNQIKSLATSLPVVLLLLVILFRSPLAGMLGMIPTGLTLLVTFGLMGMLPERFPLDIGSSMLASIALGVGIDYAIHFLWRYREAGANDAMRTTGRAIVINAAEITAGFVVLAAASIVPMSNFGLLTAVTLLVAALATLILMPAVVEFWQPIRPTGGDE
jgi:predicted RND superfamily exporter protein